MSVFLEILVLAFISGLMGLGIYFSIVKKMYHTLSLFGFAFLACLISTVPKVESLLIDDNILLQMNGAVIAGALILMTISSLPMVVKVFRTGVIFTPIQIGGGVVGIFSASSIFLLFGITDLAKVLDFAGFVWLIISSLVVTFKDPIIRGGGSY